MPLSLQGDVTDVHEALKHPRDECVCVCYLQLALQPPHSVRVLSAPLLLPPPHALLQTGQHTLLIPLQLAHTHTLLVAHALQVGDLQRESKEKQGGGGAEEHFNILATWEI